MPEPDASRRSLGGWLFDVFRTSSQPNTSALPESQPADDEDVSNNRNATEDQSSMADARTRLLESYDRQDPLCGMRLCNHGTFSPRPEDQDKRLWGSMAPVDGGGSSGFFGGSSGTRPTSARSENGPSMESSASALPLKNRKTLYATIRETVHSLSEANCCNSRYLSYYIPFFNWISQYRWSFAKGDLIAAMTVASIYIPMGLSLSENLAHAPAINGLYSFVFHPFIYAILGSSPLLTIGPEAACSLLVGTIVKSSVREGNSMEDDEAANATIVGVASALAGSMILVAGLTRLGFLDNVLSRPFLRGFITAIGFVIFVDQLIPETGLAQLAKEVGVTHGTTVEKMMFLFRNIRNCHGLTTAVSFGSFGIIMLFR